MLISAITRQPSRHEIWNKEKESSIAAIDVNFLIIFLIITISTFLLPTITGDNFISLYFTTLDCTLDGFRPGHFESMPRHFGHNPISNFTLLFLSSILKIYRIIGISSQCDKAMIEDTDVIDRQFRINQWVLASITYNTDSFVL